MSLELDVKRMPYIVGNPVPSERLVGRESVFTDLRQHLTNPINQSMILFGQRRIGKTSILKALGLRVPELKVVYIDLHGLRERPTAESLKEAVLQSITREVGLTSHDIGASIDAWTLAEQKASNQKQRLTLAIDEADDLEDESPRYSQFRAWLLATRKSQPATAWIFATGRPPSSLTHLGPLFKDGVMQVLDVLHEVYARQVLVAPEGKTVLNLDESALNAAFRLTGRHPFYLQALGELLFTLYDEGAKVDSDQIEGLAEQLITRTQVQLTWYWDEFNASERTVLATVAALLDENPVIRLSDEQEAVQKIGAMLERFHTPLGRLDVLASLKALREYRVLDTGNHLQIGLVRKWLVQEHSLSRLQLTAEGQVKKLYQQGSDAEGRNHLAEAMRFYRQALRQRQDYFPAWQALAKVQTRLGFRPEAYESYRRAYELKPDLAREDFESFLISWAAEEMESLNRRRAEDLYKEAFALYGTRQKEIQAALRQLAPQRIRANIDLIPEMCLIPAGEYYHGIDSWHVKTVLEQASLPAGDLSKIPARRALRLPSYRLARTAVTNAQYQQFVIATGARPPRYWMGAEYPSKQEDKPVADVSWAEAQAFCKWLNEQTGRRFRLPTEWEWEKAAKGGIFLDGDGKRTRLNPNPDRLWPWGDTWLPPDNTSLTSSPVDAARVKDQLIKGITGQTASASPRNSDLFEFTTLKHYFETQHLNQSDSWTEPPRLQPADSEALRQGPYDIIGLIGNLREWCEPINEQNQQAGDYLGRKVLKGAGTRPTPVAALCSARQLTYPQQGRMDAGFRLAEDSQD